jgi:hypothetical protein
MTTMTISGEAAMGAPSFEEFVAGRSSALLRTAYLLTRDHTLAEDSSRPR